MNQTDARRRAKELQADGIPAIADTIGGGWEPRKEWCVRLVNGEPLER